MDTPSNIDGIRHYSDDSTEPVLFYGGPFSNFVGGPFKIESIQPWSDEPYERSYPTVEHFYQASKAIDQATHDHVANQNDTWVAKRVGNTLTLRQDWEAVKYDVMLHGLRVKFDFDPWRKALLGTDLRYIAEDSPTDFIWGIRDGKGGCGGMNLLGKALMQLRDEIRSES